MAQKMDDAGLDRRLGKDGDDGFRKALEPVHDGDENVLRYYSEEGHDQNQRG